MHALRGHALVDTVKAAFGRVLRRERKRAGLSQEQLGLNAEVARNFVSLMELGENQPSLDTLYRLADALNLPASRLLHEVEVELRTAGRSRRLVSSRKGQLR